MIRPNIRLGGEVGQVLEEILRYVDAARSAPSPDMLVNRTTKGTTHIPLLTGNGDSVAPIRHAYVQGETQQWLKCQLESQLESDNYIWVAKPPGLRGETPPTAETYPDLVWGEPFTGERFIYRNPNERLRKFSLDASGTTKISLTQILTGYEKWPSQLNAADVATYLTANRYTSKLGLVDWIYDFQVVYPTYTTFAPLGEAVPAEGWPNVIYIAKLGAGDLPSEVPDDATFRAPFYIDLNISGRAWISKGYGQTGELAIHNLGGGSVFGASPVLPQQYTDQLHLEDAPLLSTQLPSFWPELQP